MRFFESFLATIVAISLVFLPRNAWSEDVTRLGGDFSTDLPGRHAIQVAAPNIASETRRLDQLSGFSVFHRVISKREGLGPRFNNASCAGCHVQNGRGPVKFPRGARSKAFPGSSMVVRVSLPGEDADGSPRDVPGIGEQLQDHRLDGKRAFNLRLRWRTVRGKYPDGTRYQLRRPILQFTVPGIRPQRLRHALLMTPPVIGPGLLEAVPEETILQMSDPFDADGDGISGRPNIVPNRATGQMAVGRFGYKAIHPTLEQQSASALFVDMGVTNPRFTISGRSIELPQSELDLLVIYQAFAGVPLAQRQDDLSVLQGKKLFREIGCDSCHRMTLVTGSGFDERSNQVIHPFTDLLLHDMGRGLASNRREFGAEGYEWRTAPLWGLGFSKTISKVKARFLHDGRARTIEEAILWHGGEAEASKKRFMNLVKTDREAVLSFLESL